MIDRLQEPDAPRTPIRIVCPSCGKPGNADLPAHIAIAWKRDAAWPSQDQSSVYLNFFRLNIRAEIERDHRTGRVFVTLRLLGDLSIEQRVEATNVCNDMWPPPRAKESK